MHHFSNRPLILILLIDHGVIKDLFFKDFHLLLMIHTLVYVLIFNLLDLVFIVIQDTISSTEGLVSMKRTTGAIQTVYETGLVILRLSKRYRLADSNVCVLFVLPKHIPAFVLKVNQRWIKLILVFIIFQGCFSIIGCLLSLILLTCIWFLTIIYGIHLFKCYKQFILTPY